MSSPSAIFIPAMPSTTQPIGGRAASMPHGQPDPLKPVLKRARSRYQLAVGAWVPPPPTHQCLNVSHPGGFKGTLLFSAVMHRIEIVCFLFADVDFIPSTNLTRAHSHGELGTRNMKKAGTCVSTALGREKQVKTQRHQRGGVSTRNGSLTLVRTPGRLC